MHCNFQAEVVTKHCNCVPGSIPDGGSGPLRLGHPRDHRAAWESNQIRRHLQERATVSIVSYVVHTVNLPNFNLQQVLCYFYCIPVNFNLQQVLFSVFSAVHCKLAQF